MTRYKTHGAAAAALVITSWVVLLTSADTVAQKGRPTFERKVIANTSGDVKLVGDIDGDGMLDLVLGGFPDAPLTWWRWPDLRATIVARARVEFTTDGVLADVDTDGRLDIVTADGPGGTNLIWFKNPGLATAPDGWPRREVGPVGGWAKDIKAADFDGDGRVDIVARSQQSVMIFYQDEKGSWSQVTLKVGHLGEEGMAIGDIDRDGSIDLVLCGVWVANPGGLAARDPSRWQTYPIGEFNPAFKAVVVDLDGDGIPDVLTSSSEHTADIAWFRAVDDPRRAWARHVIRTKVAGVHTLQAADIDGDGTVDVVAGQMHTTKERELVVHYNADGRGTRWSSQVIDTVGVHNGVVADVDADGDFDIYGSNWAGNPPLHLWINRRELPPSIERKR